MRNNQKLELLHSLLFVIFFLSLLCLHNHALAKTSEIGQLFIEATGNNQYEAKIKAHESGRKRAFFLIADKMGMDSKNFREIPYLSLKKVLNISKVKNEKSGSENYSATVSYSYSLGSIHQLWLRYGDQEIQDKFYSSLVIPVFKRKKIIKIWDEEEHWSDTWQSYRKHLEQHKIYYPKKNISLTQKINKDNIFSLTYEDLSDIFTNKLFKNAVIIVAEFFTDRDTTDSILSIRKIKLSPDFSPIITEERYLVEDSTDAKEAVTKIVNDLSGTRLSLDYTPDDTILNKSQMQHDQPKNKSQKIDMKFEAFADSELQAVKHKLSQISEVKNISITAQDQTTYNITITTDYPIENLAEALYLKDLTFKTNGSAKHLMNIQKGS